MMFLKHKKTVVLLMLTLLFCFVFSSCARNGEEEAPLPEFEELEPSDQKDYAADNLFSLSCNKNYSFNPFSTTNASNILCTQLMYDTIFDVDETFAITPQLVTEFSSTDGKAWRFEVDNSIKFWDGTTLTAKDVEYSIQRAMRSPQFKSRLSIIMGVSAMDDSLLIINLYSSSMQFPAYLAIPVIKNGSVEETAPMGTGPYKPNDALTQLRAFSGHKSYNKLPLDTVYLKEITEIESLISAFEGSEIDLVTNDPTGSFNLGYGSANELRYYPTTNMHYLGFNSSSRFFSNANVRKAISYAVDRENIVKSCLKGAGSVASLPISPASAYYNESFSEIVSYSVKKSEEAFEKAGVRDYDDDNFREIMIAGEQIDSEVDFIVCADSSIKVSAARSIAENMQSLGIKVNLRELPWVDYSSALTNGKFDMFYAETKLTPDFSLRSLLFYGGALNYGKFSDAVLEENISAYLRATDETRQTAADLMFKYITDTAPIIPICFEKQQVITHRGVVSGLGPTQYNIFRGIENWEINLD
jgi:peptide/nickel transport system substrate-binding protein